MSSTVWRSADLVDEAPPTSLRAPRKSLRHKGWPDGAAGPLRDPPESAENIRSVSDFR